MFFIVSLYWICFETTQIAVAKMACYLAPEKPRLSSVISETFFNRTSFRRSLNKDQSTHSRFGNDYDRQLCFHLAKCADIDCDHSVCLIADEKQWFSTFKDRLFLNKDIVFIDAQESSGSI